MMTSNIVCTNPQDTPKFQEPLKHTKWIFSDFPDVHEAGFRGPSIFLRRPWLGGRPWGIFGDSGCGSIQNLLQTQRV
jgi:hypothetical protein